VPGVDRFLGAGVFYGAALSEASSMQDRSVFVVGGGNSAAQAAVHLARYARRVVLVVRGDSLAATMSDYLVHGLQAATNIEVTLGAVVTGCEGRDRLEAVSIRDVASGEVRDEPADGLFVLIGGEPHTGWLTDGVACDRWGFVATGNDVLDTDLVPPCWTQDRPPLPFETSLPGVFAVGDVRHGSIKRVASAVGEGAGAIHSLHRYLDSTSPGR
jgi:thioredoxin reductase (NADPH)